MFHRSLRQTGPDVMVIINHQWHCSSWIVQCLLPSSWLPGIPWGEVEYILIGLSSSKSIDSWSFNRGFSRKNSRDCYGIKPDSSYDDACPYVHWADLGHFTVKGAEKKVSLNASGERGTGFRNNSSVIVTGFQWAPVTLARLSTSPTLDMEKEQECICPMNDHTSPFHLSLCVLLLLSCS